MNVIKVLRVIYRRVLREFDTSQFAVPDSRQSMQIRTERSEHIVTGNESTSRNQSIEKQKNPGQMPGPELPVY
jgi:hypothetical protein